MRKTDTRVDVECTFSSDGWPLIGSWKLKCVRMKYLRLSQIVYFCLLCLVRFVIVFSSQWFRGFVFTLSSFCVLCGRVTALVFPTHLAWREFCSMSHVARVAARIHEMTHTPMQSLPCIASLCLPWSRDAHSPHQLVHLKAMKRSTHFLVFSAVAMTKFICLSFYSLVDASIFGARKTYQMFGYEVAAACGIAGVHGHGNVNGKTRRKNNMMTSH